jgi:TolB-like protein
MNLKTLMVDSAMDEEAFVFGAFRLLPAQRILLEDGKPVNLGSRALDVLVALVESAGDTIHKDKLIARTWPDTVVDEGALRVHVAALRKALGDGRGGNRFIINMPGRGYSFVAPVTRQHAHVDNALADGAALPDKPSIAVLPFQNMSGDPEQEYFVDGMVEEITTALSRVRWLFVIARNSSFTYKGQAVDVKQVGRELGVRYVLEGSVRKAGNRARITAQLIDAMNGAHLWADRFEGTLEDVFDLQDEVTARVVGTMAPRLEQAEIVRAKRKPTESLDAYDNYLRGIAALQSLFSGTRESVDEALRLFYRSIELDPEFASPYGVAAWRRGVMSYVGTTDG